MAKGKERTSISGHHATSNVHERATLRKVPNSKRGKYYHEKRKRQKEEKKYVKDRKGHHYVDINACFLVVLAGFLRAKI